jgi:hypothetical protein
MHYLDGSIAQGMETFERIDIGDKVYELKRNCTNIWFMETSTFLDVMDFFPTNDPTDGGDWFQLSKINKAGLICAVTPKEMVHHLPEAQGKGKYNRLGHW